MADSGIVYLIICRSSGQGYVGITTSGLSRRWVSHLSASRKPRSPLGRAIAAHGRDGFALSILEDGLGEDELPIRERAWIAKMGTLAPHGLNANRGGATCRKKRSGLARQSEALAAERGICLNTARRWVRLGYDAASARSYERHGATGSRIWKRWHDMAAKGGLAPAWQDFPSFEIAISLLAKPGYRLARPDPNQSWGPGNVTLRPYGG